MDALNRIIDKRNINTIFVDIDDTLYDYEYAHAKSIKYCHEKTNIINKAINFKRFIKDYINCRNLITSKFKNNGSSRSRILALQMLFENYKIKMAYMHAYSFENLYWKTLYKFMEPNNSLIEALKTHKKNGIKVCALSDMQMRIQVEKLKKLKLNKVIDFLVTSEEVGIEKPAKKIFKYALRKLSAEPSRTLMIGDNIKKDIEGALAIGINTFHHKFKKNV